MNVVKRAKWRFSARNRRLKLAVVDDLLSRWGTTSVLAIGVMPRFRESQNVMERSLCERVEHVVVGGLDPASRSDWPRYVALDGRALPFRAGAFDLVFSNAVVEHVGDAAAQRRFVDEHVRTGRTWVITTPNRWFPIESHTNAVLAHWSARWRSTQPEFTRLLSRSELRALLPADAVILGRPWSPTFLAYGSGRPADPSASPVPADASWSP
jgi:hypothetical protein